MARILCIEDEPDIRSEIVEELTDLGHTVAIAADGAAGLQAFVEFRPDLILCDLLMPRMTGLELIRVLRDGYPEFQSTPFVFLSAFSDQSHMDEALSEGADAYLTKPTDLDDLGPTVRRLLDGESRPVPAAGGT